MIPFLLSALLTVSPVSLSGNEIAPEVQSVSDNGIDASLSDNEVEFPEEKLSESEVGPKIEYIYIPVEKPDPAGTVEESSLSESEAEPLESQEDIEVLVTVSNDSISGNSVSVNDIQPISASLASIDANMAVLLAAIEPTVSAYQVSEYYREYFKGVLLNMPYTEYLCYAERISSGGNYVTHYYLMYDLVIKDGQVLDGYYPTLDVYNQNNVYHVDEINKAFEGYPTFGYASFGPYSALVDRSFHYNDLYVGLICVAVLFLIGRKTVFS